MVLKRHEVKALLYIKSMILHFECPLKAYRLKKNVRGDIFSS